MTSPAARPGRAGRFLRGVGWGLTWLFGVLLIPLAVSVALDAQAAHLGEADGSTSFRGSADVSNCRSAGWRFLDRVQRCDAKVDITGLTLAQRSYLQADELIAPRAVHGVVTVEQHCGAATRTGYESSCFLYDTRQIRHVGWAWVSALPIPVMALTFILVWFTRRSKRPDVAGATA